MSKKFKNKVLYIKDETMLNEVRDILESNGEGINGSFFLLGKTVDYLFYTTEGKWGMSFIMDGDTEITLDEFKALFND